MTVVNFCVKTCRAGVNILQERTVQINKLYLLLCFAAMPVAAIAVLQSLLVTAITSI